MVNDHSRYTYLRIRATFILQIKNEEVVIGKSFASVEKHSEVDKTSAVFTVFHKLNGPFILLVSSNICKLLFLIFTTF